MVDPQREFQNLVTLFSGLELGHDEKLQELLGRLETHIKRVFGETSQFLSYLEHIRFKPLSFFSAEDDYIQTWKEGKKQLVNLVSLMLQDPVLIEVTKKFRDSLNVKETKNRILEPIVEKKIEKSVKQKVRRELEPEVQKESEEGLTPGILPENELKAQQTKEAGSKRFKPEEGQPQEEMDGPSEAEIIKKIEGVRKSVAKNIEGFMKTVLEDITTSKETKELSLEQELYRRSKLKEYKGLFEPSQTSELKDRFFKSNAIQPVFFIPGDKIPLNTKVSDFLHNQGLLIFEAEDPLRSNKSIIEQFSSHDLVEFVTFFLTGDNYVYGKGQSPDNAVLMPNEQVIYQLGYLIAKLGRNRLVVVHEDLPKFRRPTNYFDLYYIALDDAGRWQKEFLKRLKSSGIKISPKRTSSGV